jgi:hypothetical protein
MTEDFKIALKQAARRCRRGHTSLEQADLLLAIVLVGIVLALFIGSVFIDFGVAEYANSQSTEPAQPAKQSLPFGIDVVTVDSCQYLTWQYGPFHAPAIAMVHKANCPNHGGKP